MQSLRRPQLASAAAAAALAFAVLLAGTAWPAAARNFPDPCFSCMEQPSCALPEPKPGTEFRLSIPGKPQLRPSPPPAPGSVPTPLLEDLATRNRTFVLKYKQSAYYIVDGKRFNLGKFAANKSVDNWHLMEFTNVSRVFGAAGPHLRALVELRCKDGETSDRVTRVTSGSDAFNLAPLLEKKKGVPRPPLPPVNITFQFIMPTNRACGLPPCVVSNALSAGGYVIYKPPLVRQECPGTFLAAPSCKSSRTALELTPLGSRINDRHRWRIMPAAGAQAGVEAAAPAAAAAEDMDEEAPDVLGQPIVIQNVARSARLCASHLSAGGLRNCAASASAASVAHAGEQWVIEAGPMGPTGGMVRPMYLKAKALADAGCSRAYLCLSLSCNSTQLQLCSKDETGHNTQWLLRPTDLIGTLVRKWGLE